MIAEGVVGQQRVFCANFQDARLHKLCANRMSKTYLIIMQIIEEMNKLQEASNAQRFLRLKQQFLMLEHKCEHS